MIKYIIFILLLYGCNPPTDSDIPADLPEEYSDQYSINLYSDNLGEHPTYVKIIWDAYTGTDFISYTISNENNEIIETFTNQSEHSYILNMIPSSFAILTLTLTTADLTITESIEVFTRNIMPITNFSAIAIVEDWSTDLQWLPSIEIDSIFQNYTIYRFNSLNYNEFNNLDNCNCTIAVIDDKTSTNYIDDGSFNLGEEYFYIIETNTVQGYSRNSIVQNNLPSIDYSCTPIIYDDPPPNASQSEYNKIILNWTHNLNELEFYELQIWRSPSSDIDPLNNMHIVTITDYNKNYFEDSYNIGNGAKWYYKIQIIDIHGNSYVTSDSIIGNSHP